MAIRERTSTGENTAAVFNDNDDIIAYSISADAVIIEQVVLADDSETELTYSFDKEYDRKDVWSDFDEIARLENKQYVQLGVSRFEMMD